MERYDYYEVIKDDLKTFIEDNYNLEDFEDMEEAYDGNDGSYFFQNGAESCDVMIRCHLLSQALQEVLDEILQEREG